MKVARVKTFFFTSTILGTYAGDVVGGTDAVCEQPVAYFPGKRRRTLTLVVDNAAHDVVGRHARSTAADRPRTNRTAFVVSTEYLAHAAVRHLSGTQPTLC